jgi:hypothetical protein
MLRTLKINIFAELVWQSINPGRKRFPRVLNSEKLYSTHVYSIVIHLFNTKILCLPLDPCYLEVSGCIFVIAYEATLQRWLQVGPIVMIQIRSRIVILYNSFCFEQLYVGTVSLV